MERSRKQKQNERKEPEERILGETEGREEGAMTEVEGLHLVQEPQGETWINRF